MERKYRGYTIKQSNSGEGSWAILDSDDNIVGGYFNSAWSAMVYIDEKLQP